MERRYNNKVIQSFSIDNYLYGKKYRNKVIYTTKNPIPEDWTRSKHGGFKNGKSLLKYLENKFGGLDKFDLILVADEDLKSDIEIVDLEDERKEVIINVERYVNYGYKVSHLVEDFEFSKQYKEFQSKLAEKVPYTYFDKVAPEKLLEEFNKTNFNLLEHFVKNFDKLNEGDREKIFKILNNSGIEIAILDRFKKLEVKNPEKEIKKFIKSINSVGESKVKALSESLDISTQSKLVQGFNPIITLTPRYERLRKSLEEFKEAVKRHSESSKKDEKELHRLIRENWWLLGIEYLDAKILSAIDSEGKKTKETRFWHGILEPDFELIGPDGNSDVVIEIEEANDPVFTKKGIISTRIMDPIRQAITYSVFNRLSDEYPKSIAIVGSSPGLNQKQIKQLKLISSSVGVDVLTYEDIIRKAETVLKFFDELVKNEKSSL